MELFHLFQIITALLLFRRSNFLPSLPYILKCTSDYFYKNGWVLLSLCMLFKLRCWFARPHKCRIIGNKEKARSILSQNKSAGDHMYSSLFKTKLYSCVSKGIRTQIITMLITCFCSNHKLWTYQPDYIA